FGAARSLFSIETVPVTAIAVPTQATPINEAVVEYLTLSIKRTGILNPLLVVALPNSVAFLLVSGVHRLEVARRLGITQVPVIVRSGEVHEIEMDQLEENLARKELSFLERAFQEKRLQELYIQHYPDTVRGLAGAQARHVHETENLSFAEQMARPGSGPKTIRNRIKLAMRLGPETAAILYGTPTAHKLGELKALSKLRSEQQPQVARILAEGRAKKVEEATAMAFDLPILVRPPKTTKTIVPLENAESGRSAVASLMGRKIVVTVPADGVSVTLEDAGLASPHRGYPNAQIPLKTDERYSV